MPPSPDTREKVKDGIVVVPESGIEVMKKSDTHEHIEAAPQSSEH